MKDFTPRHMRKRYNNNKSGTLNSAKSKAFRRCKQRADKFIHQSASALTSSALSQQYAQFCADTAAGTGFRKG